MKFNHFILTAVTLLSLVPVCPTHAESVTFGTTANQFSMDFVTIANRNNPADLTNPWTTGTVSYTYRIGKYEVSRDMINKANADGSLGINLPDVTLSNPSDLGGNGPDRPATGSLFQMMRFVNWLNTSQGYQAAYKFASQPGENGYDSLASNEVWLPTDPGYDPTNVFRNSLAHYVVSSYDEWYKAAYYDPSTGAYTNYATGSNTIPTPVASGTDPNTAVYGGQVGTADVTQAGGLSAYGTMGQTGNVWEWVETQFGHINFMPPSGHQFHWIPGGGYTSTNLIEINKVFSIDTQADVVKPGVGFRVVEVGLVVPESSSILMAAIGIGILSVLAVRFRSSAL